MNTLRTAALVLLVFVFFSSNTCKNAKQQLPQTVGNQPDLATTPPRVYKTFAKDPYQELWAEVQKNFDEGKYKSAHEIVVKIDQLATKDKNGPEIIRALLAQYNLAASFMEDAEFFGLKDLEKRLDTAEGAQKAMLHLLVGRFYWSYYQRYSYQITERTATIDFKNDDFRTWEAKRFEEVSQQHHLEALKLLEELKNYPIEDFKPILNDTETNKNIVSTLYDLVNLEVMRFFKSVSNQTTEVEENSGLNRLFVPYENFVLDELKDIDNTSKKVVLQLYQDLLKTYHAEQDWNRVVFWDLERLDYLKANSSGELTQEMYLMALNQIVSKNLPTQEVAMVYAKVARELLDTQEIPEFMGSQKRLVYAKGICELALNKFDKESLGVQKCREIIAHIENKSLSFRLERVNLANREAPLKITYKNVKEVHFKVFKMTIDPMKNSENPKKITEYANEKPFLAFSQKLRDFEDYEDHGMTTILPKLGLGRYLLIASETEELTSESAFFFQDFYISDLAFSSVDGKNNTRFAVHHAEAGSPLPNVNIRIYSQEYDYSTRSNKLRYKTAIRTDKNGEQQYSTNNYGNNVLLLVNNKDSLIINGLYLRSNSESKPKVQERLQIFTDRAIYRPGQQVFFKACILQ